LKKYLVEKNKNLKIIIDTEFQLKSQIILDLFDNKKNLEFNKINILKQGILTSCKNKKT